MQSSVFEYTPAMDDFMRAGVANLRTSLSNAIDPDRQLNKVLAKISSHTPNPRNQYAGNEKTTAGPPRSRNAVTLRPIKESARFCLV